MKKVGITGNIGSGKSWVCQLFMRLGIPVFNSDDEAKRLYDREEVRTAMVKRFGEDVYLADGKVNKARVADIIFNDAEAMHDVEQILYPVLQVQQQSRKSQHRTLVRRPARWATSLQTA